MKLADSDRANLNQGAARPNYTRTAKPLSQNGYVEMDLYVTILNQELRRTKPYMIFKTTLFENDVLKRPSFKM